MANAELLQKTLDYIIAHPQEWDQNQWAHRAPSCGTTFCFAGWAVQLARPEAAVWFDFGPPQSLEDGGYATSCEIVRPDGAVIHDSIEGLAADDLDISTAEAETLFEGDNSIDDLQGMIRVLIEGGSILGWNDECLPSSCLCDQCSYEQYYAVL